MLIWRSILISTIGDTMKVQKAKLSAIDKSPYTIKSYAHSLKLFWEYLLENDIQWHLINIDVLARFVGWLRAKDKQRNVIDLTEEQAARQASSINVSLGCLSSFYQYHNHLGNTNVTITETVNLPGNRYKALLHHVYKNKPVQRRIVSVRAIKQLPKTIKDSQLPVVMNNCTNYRDKFLITLLHETGLRIGQALALRHEDIVCWDNEIHVNYRIDNLNGVRNKTNAVNIIQVSNDLMSLYSDYISSLDQNRLCQYVFINLIDYSPLNYSAVKHLFVNLSQKCGFRVRPHMLRHTHATELLKAGWEMSFIQKRLGHANVQTTIDTYTHIDNQQMKQAYKTFLSKKEKQS